MAQLLGNYGEFVGALAVVVTLGYLAVQIRQNTTTSKALTYTSIKSELNAINTAVGQNQELSGIVSRAMVSYESLSPLEKAQIDWIWLSYANTWETLFEVSRDSTKLESLWKAEERTILAAFRMGGYWEWWRQNKFGGTENFRSHMEQLMEHRSGD